MRVATGGWSTVLTNQWVGYILSDDIMLGTAEVSGDILSEGDARWGCSVGRNPRSAAQSVDIT